MTGLTASALRVQQPPVGVVPDCEFTISVDHPHRLVRATLIGFFTPAEVKRFAREEQAAVETLECPKGEHRVLIDASQCQVHTREVAEAFARLASDPPIKARRIAVVANGTLHRIQTRRILDADRSAMFDTLADAERWILADAG